MLQVSLARLKQGHRTIPYPAQEPILPDRFRGLPVVDASKCPDGCRACADACPTDAITLDGEGRSSGPGPLPVLHRLCAGLSRRSDPLHAGVSPRHADTGRLGSATARLCNWPQRPGREVAPALRPLAQAPAGQCRRLQRLRGGPERPQHRRLRPGPVRHSVRRLAAPRRRRRGHRPGQREHALGIAQRPTQRFPHRNWSSPSGRVRSAADRIVDNPEVHNGCSGAAARGPVHSGMSAASHDNPRRPVTAARPAGEEAIVNRTPFRVSRTLTPGKTVGWVESSRPTDP